MTQTTGLCHGSSQGPLLLQVLYSVRSERMLMEQLDYNLLYRWFVGLSMDDPIWDATVFCFYYPPGIECL